MANRKETAQLIVIVKRLGWKIEQTKNCHLRWTSPTGQFFFSSSTPSDRRALERIKADLRRCGLDIRKMK
jgi:hypothetical protein